MPRNRKHMERTTNFAGDPNIGVFTRVAGDIAVIPPEATDEFRDALRAALSVELVETTIQGSLDHRVARCREQPGPRGLGTCN